MATCGTDVDAAGPARLSPGGGSIVKTIGPCDVSTAADLPEYTSHVPTAATTAATRAGTATATRLRLARTFDCDALTPSSLVIHSTCRLTSAADCQRSSGSFARQTPTN